MTTTLWEGAETYVDVHSSNPCTAPHHRAGVLSRGVPPNLTRLVEDHGVCFSSCLDYWEDDVVLQAFNRSLMLTPEIYANPWLLNDAEFPLLARLFNLHRRYNQILVDGMVLPEPVYGSHAVARGDGQTRFLTIRNLSWTSATRLVKCDECIGLVDNGQPVEIRQLHPTEKILGHLKFGEQVAVDVPSFRASLLLISNGKISEIGLADCNYQIVRDLPGQPVTIKLLGMPGSVAEQVRLSAGARTFSKATLDGTAITLTPPPDQPLRYVRITPTLANGVAEVMAYRNGQPLADRSAWRASNLFGRYAAAPARYAWSCAFKLDELAPQSYLAIAIPGVHGAEGAYAAIRVNGRPVGAPDRAQSYISNGWEGLVGFTGGPGNQNYTYYIPLTADMVGKPIEAVVLQLGGADAQPAKIAPEVWITAYPTPFVAREIVLW